MAIFVYGGTLGDDGGYTKTGYALRDIKGAIKKLEKSDKIPAECKWARPSKVVSSAVIICTRPQQAEFKKERGGGGASPAGRLQ